ncbi:hypothetical protein [Thalassotalea atypica]|uniref:hypothetical protein n=1 Tax=Thalassotalea atypica TaxID=2054316 RepID=UPI002572CF50|nr:hypothetical protein [Thalassotalea atypica]
MNKTRLIEISAIVMAATLATFVVNADQEVRLSNVSIKTPAHATNNLTALFSTIDTDKDGLLSKSEISASKNDLLMRNFKAIDKNTDNSISNEELSAFSAKIKTK